MSVPDANALVLAEEGPKPVELKRWQRHFARWLANQYGKTVGRGEMTEAATKFANKPVSWSKLRVTLRNPQWRALRDRLSDEITTEVLAKAKSRSIRASKHSAAVLELSLRRAEDILADDNKNPDEHLAVIRAVGPLLNTTQDRIWPRKQEQEINQNIKITLTTHQQSRIELEPIPVEAEEVAYEVIAEEPDAA